MKEKAYNEMSAFKKLEDCWNDLLEESSSNDIFLTWQWQSTWWTHFGKGKELGLLAVRSKEGDLLGLAPFFLESLSNCERVVEFIGGTDITDYLDIIVQSGSEEDVCREIVDFLESIQDDWDSVDLHCLKETSIALNVLKPIIIERGYSVTVSQEDVCPKIILPSSWNDYLDLLSKKDRHELRRKIRRIEGKSQSVYNKNIEDQDSLVSGMEQFFSLHRDSNSQKKSFMHGNMEAFFQAIAHTLFAENWFKLSFLHRNGTSLASSLCFEYENKTYLYNSGYDPKNSSLSPGIVHVAHLIREAIEAGRMEFDFLRGNEPYKYRFGARDSYIYRMIIKKID
ncbi:MAG: GNAT family N-acetyltransferase [Thermodesulfobacteriota bacterium]|nr:GNAT family N-acetyltransferase [Thermodesulfobacteriota bacterium]